MPTSPTPADRPAEELRAAAELLRQTATTAGGKPWAADHFPEGTIVRPAANTHSLFRLAAHGNRAAGTPCVTPAVGAHIALMHPGAGLALADWLEREAEIWQAIDDASAAQEETGVKVTVGLSTHAEALAVARQLLGTSEGEGRRSPAAAPTVAATLATPCDACDHTLNWHRNDVGCTVPRCVCGRFQDAVEPTAALPAPADRAALTETERQLLGFALEMAEEEIHARNLEIPEKDQAALTALRRLADGAAAGVQPPTSEARPDDIQVWPLTRVLTEIRCGSRDWTWDEEWADLDQRHAETGYLDRLEQQIKANGITMPVLIGSDGRLWDGHHRLRIAVRLGIAYVPVEITPAAPTTTEPEPLTEEQLIRQHVTTVHLIGDQLANVESWLWQRLADARDTTPPAAPAAPEEQR